MGKRKQITSQKINSLVIGTFSNWKDGMRTPTNGMIEPLISFFGPKCNTITLIDCPHPGSDDVIPKIEMYRNGVVIKKTAPYFLFPPLLILNSFNQLKTQPLFKIRDFVTTIQVLLSIKNVDLFIGLESIFTLAGILFKKIGKIKIVVYYVSDYSPQRYTSKIFNSIYLWLDKFCATHADFIWDVSSAMMAARLQVGLKKDSAKPVILVPNALFPYQIHYLPYEKLNPYSLVFAGTIGPENGLDLAIEAFAIAKKKLPKLTLHILGGGLKKDELRAQQLIKKLKLQNSVYNHGFISDLSAISKVLRGCMVGLAPYRALSWSVRWYADATKIRLYFASGLPVITTNIPPLGHEALKKGCAIVTKDDKQEFALAIIKMLSDKNGYLKMRASAIKFAKNNTWENTYSNALQSMFRT